jgi:multidrug resistance protein, MATE family
MTTTSAFTTIYSEIRQSLRLSIPLVASELMYGLSGFVATIFVAHLGHNELAAGALVWSIYITLILFFIGILCATGILASQSYGANDYKGVRTATQQGFILAAIFTAPMMLIMWVAPKFLIWSGQNPAIIKLATPYFHSLAWCILPLNVLIVMEQFLLGIAQPRLVLLISLINVPFEIMFFYSFIFGKFGAPAFGLPGIGYGFLIAFTISAICIGYYLHTSRKCCQYKLFSNWKVNKIFLKELLRIGTPMGGMFCIEVALLAAIALMMGRLGSDVLAAHQIAYQCFSLTVTIIFGLSQGTSIRIGHEVGRNNKATIKLAAWVNIWMGVCIVAIIASCYILFPRTIIAFDLNINDVKYQQLINYAVTFLAIAAIAQITDCVRLICNSALRGLKDTKFSMYLSAITFWLIAFPCAYIFGFVAKFGGAGIWWGFVIGLMVSTIILLIRFNKLINTIDLKTILTK